MLLPQEGAASPRRNAVLGMLHRCAAVSHRSQRNRTVPEIYVDADACPVKDEVLRVADRHGLSVHMVGNQWLRLADDPAVHMVLVPAEPDAADDWIAAHVAPGDIVVTADIPLAARCLAAGAAAIGPTGRPFTDDNIGMALAVRDLTAELRDAGTIGGGPAGFSARDRSQFLQALEAAVQRQSRR